MRAVITLDDVDEDGKPGLGMTVFLENGWTPTSQAHQAANALVTHLEGLSAVHTKGELKTVFGEDAAWIKDEVVAPPNQASGNVLILSEAG